jgi:FixJ family two-component response regulator
MQCLHRNDENFAFPADHFPSLWSSPIAEPIRNAGGGTVQEDQVEEIIMTDRTRETTLSSNLAKVAPPVGITLAVVADDESFRDALTFQLLTAGCEVAAYRSAESFLESEPSSERDCVVADIYLPRMNGLQLLAEIKRSMSCAQVVFLTGCGDLSCGVQAMREGAVDYLEKPTDDQRLLHAVRRAAELARRNRAEHAKHIELRRREVTLTPREREVFALVTAGLLNKQVGAELGATERTIKTHRGRVMGKMNADSLAELVRMAELLRVPHSPARAPNS